MKVELKKINQLKRILKIEVSADKLSKNKSEVYKAVAKNLKVPGFRLGNAPIELVEKHHKSILHQELLKKVIPLYYSNALDENKLEAVGSPRIYDVNFDGGELSFCAEFEIKPVINLADDDYKKLKIKMSPVLVEPIEVEKLITQFKDNIKKITGKDYSDEALAKWSGYPTGDSFKQAVHAQIFMEKLRSRRADIEKSLSEELIKKIKIEIPLSLLEEQQDKLFQQETYNLRVKGVKEDDIKKYEDDIKRKLKPIATTQIKLYYIIDAIAKRESLTVDEHNVYDSVIGYILSCAECA